VADHLHVDEVTAPDLYGLVPDDAARACYEQDLAVAVDVADMVEVRGWDPARVRVTAQWPSPGSRMDGTTVVVLVDIVDGGDDAGVREPRRPSPPLRAPGIAPDDESAAGSNSY
jgi:hypothetical protein